MTFEPPKEVLELRERTAVVIQSSEAWLIRFQDDPEADTAIMRQYLWEQRLILQLCDVVIAGADGSLFQDWRRATVVGTVTDTYSEYIERHFQNALTLKEE